MKVKYILILLVLFFGYTAAQTEYPLVTIQDIQYIPDSLLTSDKPSPLIGDTVRFRGLVMVRPVIDPISNRGVVISAGSRWSIYVQDPEGGLWGGMNVIQHDTTLEKQATQFALIDTGQVVEFTGVVEEYLTSTQVALVLNPPIEVQIIDAQPKRPEPIEVNLSDLFTSEGAYNFDAEKYEGMYIIFRNIISSDRSSNGNFKVNDGEGNFAFIYNQSRYFKTGTAGIIPEYQPPQDGSYLSYLRGIVTTRADGYYIVPVYPGDIGPVLTSPPVITSIKRKEAIIGPNDPIEVSANIKDLDGYVAGAKLYYRVNGGDRLEVEMTKSVEDSLLLTAIIPAVNLDSALVDYYIKSTDNQGNISTAPSDTITQNYLCMVLNRPVTIADVQYSPLGSGYSAFNNQRISVTGIVTASADDLPGYSSTPLRIYIQDGSGPWSGLQVGTLGNLGTEVITLRRGDNVTINGLIMEGFNVTKIDSISSFTINSSDNSLPDVVTLTTGEMGLGGGTVLNKEKWESVLVQFENVTIDSTNADGSSNFGEILVNDGSGVTRVELQDGNHNFNNGSDDATDSSIVLSKGDRFEAVKGVMYYSFSNYKLAPRTADDFEGYEMVGVNDQKSTPAAYSLNQNYPNPFNPSTVISYSIAKEGMVKIRIYNILGQEIITLVNQSKTPGVHKVTFDASRLNSGVYFYSLETDGFQSVKKMMLLK